MAQLSITTRTAHRRSAATALRRDMRSRKKGSHGPPHDAIRAGAGVKNVLNPVAFSFSSLTVMCAGPVRYSSLVPAPDSMIVPAQGAVSSLRFWKKGRRSILAIVVEKDEEWPRHSHSGEKFRFKNQDKL